MTAYNDRIMNDLSSYKGNFNERVFQYLGDQGHLEHTLPERLRAAGMTINTITTDGETIEVVVSSISSDGWQATSNDISGFNTTDTVQVTRNGFDNTGSQTTYEESVLTTKRVRQPYPNEASLTTDTVSLGDYIYASDIVAGVTNNSTLNYPKPIAFWGTENVGVATGSTYTVRLAVAHAYGRNGTPVAAVKFSVTDGTNTVEQTVNTLTPVTYTASGLTAQYYEADIDLTALDADTICTVDAVIYPWIGEAFTISTDADTYPSPNLTVLKFLNDKNGTYGRAYAYVDSTSGNDGTGVVSETASTAQANPYATVSAAAGAIKTYNTNNFSRSDASNGVIRLVAGTHTHSSLSSVSGGDVPLIIEATIAENKTVTIYRDPGSSVSNGLPDKLKFKDITLQKQGGSVVFFDSAAGLNDENFLIFENCVFDMNSTSYYGAWFYRVGIAQYFDCTSDTQTGMGSSFGTTNKTASFIGCGLDGDVKTVTYNCIATKDLNAKMSVVDANSVRSASAGQCIMWSHLGTSNAADSIFSIGDVINDRGMALVGSIFESYNGAGTSPCVRLNADSDNSATENLLFIGNTVVGNRLNGGYLDGSTNNSLKHLIFFKNNIIQEYNTKDDTFGSDPNGVRVNNWSVTHKIGWGYNAYFKGSSDDDYFADTSWLGAVGALGDVTGTDATPLVTNFVDDASYFEGDNTGDGDYHVGVGNNLPTIPPARLIYQYNLYGEPAAQDGTDHSGACF